MRRIVTILIVLGGIAAVFMALAQQNALDRSRELMETGAQAEGRITEQSGAHKSNSRFYSYRFRAGEREWTATRRDIPWAARELPLGSSIPVRYDPRDPSRSLTPAELEELEGWGNRMLFPGLALLLLGWAASRVVRGRR